MIPDRNNYANNDVEILYRLYLMYLMYVHNYSVQSFDNSERMIVMLCAYKVSFRIGFFLFLLFLCLICVQRYKNETKSFCVVVIKWYEHAIFSGLAHYISLYNALPHTIKDATGVPPERLCIYVSRV